MDITIFLADTASTSREFCFREWDGTRSNAEARMASAGDDGTITLDFAPVGHESTEELLERVYAATNGHPYVGDSDVTLGYYDHKVRSLSVGDIVHVPGEGLFAVANAGFTRMHLHLPSDDVERNLDGDDATRTTEHIELPADAPVTCACGDCEREHAAILAEDRAQSIEWERAEDERYESRFDTEGA